MSSPKGRTAAERLAAFGAETRLEDLPGSVVDGALLRVLDTIGCGLAAHASGAAAAPRQALLDLYGPGPATVLGSARGLPATAAACANGTLCHALDYDDTHAAGIVNVGAIVVPAALALAEVAGASGAELLTAVVVGSEVVARLGLAAAPSFMESGFHPAAVCGVFGAAAAAACLLELDRKASVDALAIAGSLASGTYEPLYAGASTKTLHAGWAAQSGIMAALFARAGQDGPATVLEGPYGVFAAHFRLPPEAVFEQLGDLGVRWESDQVSVRAYPVCYLSQSALDATRAATGGRLLTTEDVREVRVSIPAAGLPIVFEPRAGKLRPRSSYEARFSLPYCVAAMLVRGRVDLDAFAVETVSDAEVLAMAERVVYAPGEFPGFPASYPAAVAIETTNGDLLQARVEHERGGPVNPMSADEVRLKFRNNAARALAGDQVDRLEQAVGGLRQSDGCVIARALHGAFSVNHDAANPGRGASRTMP